MKKILERKNINHLYHFTKVDNLKNIFKHGLVPRSILDKEQIKSSYNDDFRYDNCIDAICMSIEFPNYKMFYKLRQEKNADWVILCVDSSILVKSRCAYCWTNAGDNLMSSLPISKRCGKTAFLELFEDKEGFPDRIKLRIPDFYPTNPQAEVLVFDIISTELIKEVLFNNYITLNKYKDIIPNNITTKVDIKKFKPRVDWESW